MTTTDRLQPRSGHPRAVDWMLAAYNLVMIGRWAPLVPQHETARWLVAVHSIALGVPWLLSRAPAPDHRWLRRFYECYPLVWICAFWRELDVHGRFVSNLPDDRALVWLDHAVFGLHLNSAWIEALPGRAFSEMMHLFYFSYYPLLIAAPVLLLLARRGAQRREGVLRIAAAYLACFCVYAWWPTTGPDFLHVVFPESVRGGLVFRLNHLIQDSGDSLGTAFPSSHVAGAVTVTWILWRLGYRRLGVVGIAITAGALGATVYTQNHFAVDAVAGLLLGLGVQGWVVPRSLPVARETVVGRLGQPRIHVQPARAA
ncbi:MAG TPA: phosphatase PAP2 family protein [Candidatus Dormibacteraeota bacterium]|nr:phosphatase PAP2 family protein [Candidatus Dormibacteraeota bacterium]